MLVPTADAANALRTHLRETPLRTARLNLRLPRATDADAIFHGYAADPVAIRWMGFRPHETVATVAALVASWCAAWDRGEGMLAFVIEERETMQFLGVVDLSFGPHGATLGYILGQHAWGRGIATEAAQCVVNLAFTRFGIWRVWATCAPQNPASRRVLEKVGMRPWIESPLVHSEPRDLDCMAITRDDWLAMQSS